MECVWTQGSLLGLPSRLSAWSRKIKIKIERRTGLNNDIDSGTFYCDLLSFGVPKLKQIVLGLSP
jgi:hypothetical protein